MPSAAWTILAVAAALAAILVAFLVYADLRYGPIVARIFEEKPMFLPLRVGPAADAEDVRFPTNDGLTLAGAYFPHRGDRRLGVVAFCPEYLGDRWSVSPYLGHLRDAGFDLFSFDFRNHASSESTPTYTPHQWVTDYEVGDLRAALRYLRSRPDADPAGVGLFGVSRGGGAALCVAGKDAGVWGVATDGAFATRTTMLLYIKRWAEIYVESRLLWRLMPTALYEFLGWAGRKRSQKLSKRRFPSVIKSVARISPRPLLLIHGEKDGYIPVAIARGLFAAADEPKSLYLVPKAKHNRSRVAGGQEYLDRIAGFYLGAAPRVAGPAPAPPAAATSVDPSITAPTDPAVGRDAILT